MEKEPKPKIESMHKIDESGRYLEGQEIRDLTEWSKINPDKANQKNVERGLEQLRRLESAQKEIGEALGMFAGLTELESGYKGGAAVALLVSIFEQIKDAKRAIEEKAYEK